jgi:hypothetical protein
MKKFTKQQIKNRKQLSLSLNEPIKSREQITKEHIEFQKMFEKRFG